MTCREFKHSAASLTLWELSRSRDEAVLGHTEECESCRAWLQKQRALAGSMKTLQARTAVLEASPDVERALLRAFRQAAPARAGVTERSQPVAVPRSTPVVLRLSRFFEIGAYAAVAAAIMVGVFLGVRLLQPNPQTAAAQNHAVESAASPALERPMVSSPVTPVSTSELPDRVASRVRVSSLRHSSGAAMGSPRVVADESQASAEAGYVPLMFCDPLSCAADSEVVRMELPAQNDAQAQLADVVVGLDGVVRAVRIVN
jgi:hypothetical protein